MGTLRTYVLLQRTPSLLAAYQSGPKELLKYTQDHLLKPLGASPLVEADLMVASNPSLDWTFEVVGDHPPIPICDKLIVSYGFNDPQALLEFRDLALKSQGKALDGGNMIYEVGADLGNARTDHWCPQGANNAVFGHRSDARNLLDLGGLGSGKSVNVVIVDEGLDRNHIPPANWGGGLGYKGKPPGSAPRDSHGMMVARNVLDIAPNAILYDVPLIPERIVNVLPFASDAHAIYCVLEVGITFLRLLPRWSGPWVILNAWAIFDRASETPLGDYTQNTHPLGHPFNNIVGGVVGTGIDVIFAAGNCGQFCPSDRCGPIDRGPGHSIWGANSHPAVITVGAVRTDELWLGYSSQGPGQPLLAGQKPDFCAPSNFRETIDAAVQNTGTSAAAALTAGVVAALRSDPRWPAALVAPAAFKQRLIVTARQTAGPAWSDRIGFGILDAAAAFQRLAFDFP
jgi:hypothetical protein